MFLRVTRSLVHGWWLLAISLAVIVTIWWMAFRSFKGDGGGAITAAIFVVATGTIVQNASFLLPPTQVTMSDPSFAVTEDGNVWVLIFDELASSDYLAETGETPLISALLRERGFEVTDSPSSPYSQTILSLGSTLSLEPMGPGAYDAKEMAKSRWCLAGTIRWPVPTG